jgi:arginase
MLGNPQHPAAAGPPRYLEGGATDILSARGHRITVELVERSEAGLFPDAPSAAVAVSKTLAPTVARAIEAGRLPIVLAGSCDASLGVLAGFDHTRCGVVWIDAHADFNTPESSVSGFFPGMSVAVVAGHCHADLWAQAGDAIPIPEERILMLGTRELSPEAERERLERSAGRRRPLARRRPPS